MTTNKRRHSALMAIVARLREDTGAFLSENVDHIYRPLDYAREGHEAYLRLFGADPGRVLLIGMNPGPWGMAQCGVPFGAANMVRDYLGIDAKLTPPLPEQHPRYPILGAQCKRKEGSGDRLWGWAQSRHPHVKDFASRFFIWNYCPLLLLANNRNLTPDRLPANELQALEAMCDRALRDLTTLLAPRAVFGIGRYAQRRAQQALGDATVIDYLPHPSPASPAANRGWTALAEQALAPWIDASPKAPV